MAVIRGPMRPLVGDEELDAMEVSVYGPMAQAGVCFYCGDSFSYPLVYWAGVGSMIFLHSACAHDLGVRLCEDATASVERRHARP